jgi:hypothetical protein
MTAEMVSTVHVSDREAPTLVLVSSSPALIQQQAFLAECERLLRKAGCSGQRLVTALFHILTVHTPVLADGSGQSTYYACRECRLEGRQPAEQYPCRTAQEACWALDAVLG